MNLFLVNGSFLFILPSYVYKCFSGPPAPPETFLPPSPENITRSQPIANYVPAPSYNPQEKLNYQSRPPPRLPLKRISLSQRHGLSLLLQLFPIIRLQLRVLNPFLRPILTEATNMILRRLEVDEFVADTLLHEDTTGMLGNDRLLVLENIEISKRGGRKVGE